jgi:hypothetical protein
LQYNRPICDIAQRRFIERIDRSQATLFPECLEDWIDDENPVRVIDAFVEKLDLSGLGFDGVTPEATGRKRAFGRWQFRAVNTRGMQRKLPSETLSLVQHSEAAAGTLVAVRPAF